VHRGLAVPRGLGAPGGRLRWAVLVLTSGLGILIVASRSSCSCLGQTRCSCCHSEQGRSRPVGHPCWVVGRSRRGESSGALGEQCTMVFRAGLCWTSRAKVPGGEGRPVGMPAYQSRSRVRCGESAGTPQGGECTTVLLSWLGVEAASEDPRTAVSTLDFGWQRVVPSGVIQGGGESGVQWPLNTALPVWREPKSLSRRQRRDHSLHPKQGRRRTARGWFPLRCCAESRLVREVVPLAGSWCITARRVALHRLP
jgi:hypothetical protein